MSSSPMRRKEAAMLFCGGLAAGALAAQPAGSFLDTVDVNVVNVEVVVTDREGNPMLDLGPETFTVWEDGAEMELSNFFAVSAGRVLPSQSSADEVALPAAPETPGLQLVLLFDDLNIRPENRNRMIDRLRDYLAQRSGSGDLMMLVRTGDGISVEQPFTADRGLVLEALERLERRASRQVLFDMEYRSLMRRIDQARLARPDPLNPLALEAALLEAERLGDEIRIVAERRYLKVRRTVEMLEQFTRTLAGVRGRKGILYVSDGMPTRAAEALVAAWQGKFEAWLRANNQAQVASRLIAINSIEFDSSRYLKELVQEANANRVAFYPISDNKRRARAALSAEHRGNTSESGAGPSSLATAELESRMRDESLLQMAEGTGGLAFTSSSDIGGLIDRMHGDFSSFYSLGYLRPTAEDREYHQIEVRVADPDLRVRHLEGYRRRDPTTHLQDLTLSALHHDLAYNPLEVRLQPGEQRPAEEGRFIVSMTLTVPFSKLLMVPEQESHVAHLTLVVAARDARGGVSEPQRIELPIRVPNERIAETADRHAAYPLQLEMRPGPQRVSVGVRDQLARVDSTLSVSLEVGRSAGLPRPPEPWMFRRAVLPTPAKTTVAAR